MTNNNNSNKQQEEKLCIRCGEIKPATAEYFPPKGKRLGSWCRMCVAERVREYRRKNKEAVAETERMRYRKNREKILQKNRENYKKRKERNGEEIKKYKRDWQRQYRERIYEERRRALESEDYSDLVPMDGVDTFRAWAVITSGEYGYILQKGVDSVAGDDVE